MMKRQLVKILGPAERDMLEPHIEAVRRFERVVQALAPEQGLEFDKTSLSFYRLVDDAEGEG